MMCKRALITGITGQDGSYLTHLLLENGYEVHGLVRTGGGEIDSRGNLAGVIGRVKLHPVSLEDSPGLSSVIGLVKPDECYHLAGQTFVSYDAARESATIRSNIDGTHALLSSVKREAPDCRFVFAGSSEMFGQVQQSPQNESTPFQPRSIYGITKVSGYHLVRYYRQTHRLHASTAILFNHESPRRGTQFVTRKITSGVARIRLGKQEKLTLGDLDARRDWGFAGDYVQGMWLMARQPVGDDFVLSTSQTHSVRELCDIAFAHAGLDYRDHVIVDPALLRPPEAFQLLGDSTKARTVLGWEARMPFSQIITSMVDHDLKQERNGRLNVAP